MWGKIGEIFNAFSTSSWLCWCGIVRVSRMVKGDRASNEYMPQSGRVPGRGWRWMAMGVMAVCGRAS